MQIRGPKPSWLQVWFGDEPFGALNLPGREMQGRVDVVVKDEDPFDCGFTGKGLCLAIGQRNHLFDMDEIIRLSPPEMEGFLREKLVPPYAEMMRDSISYQVLATWDAVIIHETHHERLAQVFDLDMFEPFNIGPDVEEHLALQMSCKKSPTLTQRYDAAFSQLDNSSITGALRAVNWNAATSLKALCRP
jgi:hypothetical protein